MDWIKPKIGALLGATFSLLMDFMGIHWIVIHGIISMFGKALVNGAGGALGGLVITMVAKAAAIAIKNYQIRKSLRK